MTLHIPVLLDRVIDLLAPAVDATSAQHRPVVVDATLGLGGHTEAMLERFPDLVVVGIDRDPEAIARSAERLARFGERVVFVNAVYDQIGDALRDAGFASVSGVLFDLGVSSPQHDRADQDVVGAGFHLRAHASACSQLVAAARPRGPLKYS